MKKRSTEILLKILEGKRRRLKVEELLEHYQITKKTLRGDVKEMEDFLRGQGKPDGICIEENYIELKEGIDLEEAGRAVYQMDAYDYKMSLDERKIYIILTLLYCDSYYTMQKLSDELYVTRNTIINDCKVVEQYLEQFGVRLTSKSKRGICLEYDAEKIVLCFIDMFHGMMPDVQTENGFFPRYIEGKIGFIYRLSDVIQYENQYIRENSVLFANEVFYEIGICIYVMLNLTAQGMQGLKSAAWPETEAPVDMIEDMVLYVSGQIGQPLDRAGLIFMEKIILTRGIYIPAQSINDFELYGVICHFLLEIGNEIQVNLQTDDLLIRSLISHIKSMKNWGDIEIDIEKEYLLSPECRMIRDAAENKFYILERYLMYQLNESMKDSIVIHISAALLRDWEAVETYRVIVSCPGSMATSKYLEAQIRNYFNFTVVDVMTTREIERVGGKFADIDFIISTVPVRNSALPVVVVNPLITVEDIGRIQKEVYQKQENRVFQRKHGKTSDLAEYPVFAELYEIYLTQNYSGKRFIERKMRKLLEDIRLLKNDKEYRSKLLNMLNPRYMLLERQRINWREAMVAIAEDMLMDGCFDKEYVNEAIENVEEYGSYIIVNQGIALAHASNKSGACREAIGLMVDPEGIVFDDGERVELLFFFSPESGTDYLNLFREIIELGNDRDKLQKIKLAASCDEIYQHIEEVLE